MSQFAAALEKVAKADYPPLEKVVIGLRKVEDAQGLAALSPLFSSASQLS